MAPNDAGRADPYFNGLRELPFALTPNPEQFFPWEQPQSVLAGWGFALLRATGS